MDTEIGSPGHNRAQSQLLASRASWSLHMDRIALGENEMLSV